MAPWGSSSYIAHSTVLLCFLKLVCSSTLAGLQQGTGADVPSEPHSPVASLSEQSSKLHHRSIPLVPPSLEVVPPDGLHEEAEEQPEEEVPEERPLEESPDLEEEFKSLTLPPHLHHKQSFKEMDANEDGYITRSEFNTGFAGSAFPKPPCKTDPLARPAVHLTPEEELAILCKECQATAGLGTPEFRSRCLAEQSRCHVWLAPSKPAPYHGANTVGDAEKEVNKFTRLETEVLEKSGQSEAAAEIVRRDKQEDEAGDSEAVGINIVVAVLGIGLTACSGVILGYEIEETMRKKKAKKEADAAQPQTPVAEAGWEQGEGEEWGGAEWGEAEQDASAQQAGGDWGQPGQTT